MSYLKNLDRDMRWQGDLPELSLVSSVSFLQSGFNAVDDGSVYDIHGEAQCGNFDSSSAGFNSGRAFGCRMLQPIYEPVPYRFKGAAASLGRVTWFSAHYDTVLSRPADIRVIAHGYEVDEIVCQRVSADGWYPTSPLFFGCFFHTDVALDNSFGSLSVQRLLSQPDQYARGVT
jgi:hypothetical protein